MIKINTASIQELIEVVHIGPKRAQLIIDRRSKDKFKDIYELSVIPGFGKIRINDIISEGKLVI